ncbi:C4-dicarboxylate ABC transporter substrate-binding protein [Zafaria cholistanensis]|uniref:C4-dicarboxylate ABC transporter substrate-binding protein n=1 Tax=Zafaria cholistanensis TaxID=1682741 RepID=A0A5A7NSX3_9MICC|nr:TRAP transporter large permease subunit [Zafaria cholistanensis]GER23900.1 C4-dicarboxylate ABC transporter substrate-binding protein [Zafaria cholistanensis]
MIGVWALGAYLAVIILWTTLMRRNVGEAMMVGFLVAAAFNGADALSSGWAALYDALTDEIVYATVVFVFMGYLLEKAGVMERMINLLDALIGGRKGGSAYVSTVASAGLGSIVHNQAAIAATVGSVTIPWMERAKMDRTTAATIVAGNAGMGITFPFSASMFVLVGSSTVGPLLDVDSLILPLVAGGLWCVLHRLIVTAILVRRSGGQATAKENRPLLLESLRRGWTTLLLFVGVALPMFLTTGLFAQLLSDHTGADVSKAVSPIFWIPVVLIALGLVLGRRQLPRSPMAWAALIGDSAPRFGVVGITVLFAFAGANALATTGLPEQLSGLLGGLDLPVWLLALVIGLIVVAVAAPLSSTATMAAVGTIGVAALIAAGVPAPTAAVAVLIFSSCEAAVPPGGAPLYVACGIAGVDPLHTFRRMLLYYALPLLGIGVLVATGILPV